MHSGSGEELAPWKPNGVQPMGAPRERPTQDQRFRPARNPLEVPQDQRDRTRLAVDMQCTNARVPGYTGFIPSSKAEDVYGHTQATVGRRSLAEQTRRQGLRETASAEAFAAMSGGGHRSAPSTPQYADLAPAPDPHPLGKSRAEIVRNHWVPTIPGYGGYVPAKHAENICGGGIMHTCKMAGRAIAERAPMNFEPLPAVTQQDDVQRARLAEYYHSGHRAERSEVHVKLATELREHCSKSIPGYMGYIPRVKSDSIYGARPKDINRIAADLMEDRIFNPENHGHTSCAPQAPGPRQLRA
mmetsp:Transcript_25767/g.41296  ORF Transcript_25767/g.41296 Transcript_25767/m.41296 type:complete len:300 (+) Transcript_25767:107-1006(+)